jgi:Putative stress-induced transcription regulator
VDLASYADLAVRLVNTAAGGHDSPDGLATVESYRSLVADRPYLASRVTASDVAALKLLRRELALVFRAAAGQREGDVVALLNALLTRHPIHQEITRHDGGSWHLHLVDSGSAADKYAAGAIAGLTALIAGSGVGRLGMCAASGCGRAHIDSAPGADSNNYCDRCAPTASVRPLPARGRRSSHGPASTAAS